MTKRDRLEQAIGLLETQRDGLGDAGSSQDIGGHLQPIGK